jgi:hypothetical protein
METNQEFQGFVFVGVEKRKHMAGTFGYSENPKDHEAGWFAERE